jgi:hypothetical protein
MAMRPYIDPSVSPLMSCCTNISMSYPCPLEAGLS